MHHFDMQSINAPSALYDPDKVERIPTIRATPFTWEAHSLDFDSMRTKIFKSREKTKCTTIMEWVAYFIIGTCTGLTTAILMHMESFLVHEKRYITNLIIAGEES